MANVNTYLARILSATYGEEVRSAIHDSINAMNIESSNAMKYARTAQESAAASATAAGESATTALGAKADALLAAGNAIAAESSIDAKVADVMTMKSNLILNHAIYQELYDSNLNVLLDSAGGSILGEVIFSDVEDVTRLHKRIDDLDTIQAAENAAAVEDVTRLHKRIDDLETIENSIDAKVADVMTMKSNLILNHAIYQELYDSNLNVLLDSTEGSILGEVIFSDVEDVTRLHKRIDDLETIINQLTSLLIHNRNRLVIVETSMTEANESITRINEHALFDSTFI